ncbi:MAG: DUF3772 domain-containing protein, partial [Stenotrophomonas maltophilia]
MRSLSWLLLLAWLGAAPIALAQAGDPDPDPAKQLVQAEKTFRSISDDLEDAATTETLKTLSDRALAVQRDADGLQSALDPLLKQVDARLSQLGEVAEGTVEPPEVSRQRKALNQQKADINAQIARAKLLSVDAKQLGERIEKMRVTQFSEQLTRKVASPLSPALWRSFAKDVPADVDRLAILYHMGVDTARKAIARHGWTAPLIGLGVALVMFFPL